MQKYKLIFLMLNWKVAKSTLSVTKSTLLHFISTTLKNLGENIKFLRLAKNYSQENISDILNISVSGYKKIEDGISNTGILRTEKIATILGLSVAQLLAIGENKSFTLNIQSVVSSHLIQSNISNIYNQQPILAEIITSAINEVLSPIIKNFEKRLEDLEKKQPKTNDK